MRSVWTWNESQTGDGWIDKSQIIRQSVLMAKGKPNPFISQNWASELYRRSSSGGLLRGKRNWLLIVPPSVQIRGDGHASELARELSRLAGNEFPDFPVFQRQSKSIIERAIAQKAKNRIERLEAEMSLFSGLSGQAKERILRSEGFIFVDDVIVTGSTAIAAWKALGKPRNFEAWAMVWRACEPRGTS